MATEPRASFFTLKPFYFPSHHIILIDSDYRTILTFLLREIMILFGISRCSRNYGFLFSH